MEQKGKLYERKLDLSPVLWGFQCAADAGD
jgi:hypothetical protein